MRTQQPGTAALTALFALASLSLGACAPSVPTGDAAFEGGSPDGSSSDAVATESGAAVFGQRVVEFSPGEGAGFGQSRMPDIVLGRPEGAGDMRGGTHVVSLGRGGRICLEMAAPIVDREGADFIVFENGFIVAGSPEVFVELGEVSVSEDGARFATFACDTRAPYRGCAGVNPVYASSTNTLDPTDPRYAGGDAFALATVGVGRARIVCVRDLSTREPTPPSSGFDLDAIASVHADR